MWSMVAMISSGGRMRCTRSGRGGAALGVSLTTGEDGGEEHVDTDEEDLVAVEEPPLSLDEGIK